MGYNNDTYNMEEMKQQLELLKKRLDEQSIINEKHIMQAMQKKMYGLGKRGRILFVLGLFVAMWAPSYFAQLGTSYWFCGATFIMLLFCALKTLQFHRDLWRVQISNANLMEVAEKVALLRKRYKEWYKIALAMIIPWLIWLGIEVYKGQQGEETLWILGGIAVGTIIGGLLGNRINKKMVDTTEELLREIQEYRKGGM